MGAVAQLQARRDVVDDVLHGPLRVEQPVRDLGRVEAVGEQPDHGGLALRQARERQAARRQDLALELADLAQQPPQQVRRQRALAGRGGAERRGEVAGASPRSGGGRPSRRPRPPRAGSGRRRATPAARPAARRARAARASPRRPRCPARRPRRAPTTSSGGSPSATTVNPCALAQLADDARPGQRVRGGDVRPGSAP